MGQGRLLDVIVYTKDKGTIEGQIVTEKYGQEWVISDNVSSISVIVNDEVTKIDKSKIKSIELDENSIYEVLYGNTTAAYDHDMHNDFHVGQYLTKGNFEVFKVFTATTTSDQYGGSQGSFARPKYFWIRNGKFKQLKKPDFMESLRKIAITNADLAEFLEENDKKIRKDEQFEKILKFYAELEL
ncbi:MAG: hypothetical protein AAGC88_04970 [Bacteroidota bacterium]